ncbi:E3 ubiquitin-protein ligase TRIM17-like [Sarcophilus harrisii]|uniref:E3 ubiquitin-protein ligase TRIM17-like n=1 Tax=Sarcophilus harrisii TaxID=9305 RepID=UPI001301C5FA|nr:E3 ubiquitin-protein ligase TRIM17-like [Sarcophilus harrisii]
MADEVQEGLCINCSKEDINLIRVECGHNICMSCFRNKTSPPLCCTICWEFSQLRTLIDMAMYPEGEGMCEIHREDLKLFCERKKTLLCVTCSKSGSHENHIHWSIPVAALCYRDFTNRGEIIQKVLKQVWEYLPWKKANEENFIVGKENKKFNELNQRLKEMETIQEHQIMQKKKEWETMMSNQNRCLTSVITELEEKLHKPDIAVLQDIAETLERKSSTSACNHLDLGDKKGMWGEDEHVSWPQINLACSPEGEKPNKECPRPRHQVLGASDPKDGDWVGISVDLRSRKRLSLWGS